MIKVEIHLFATLAPYLPDEARKNNRMIEVEDGTTIGELLQQLRIPSEKAKLIFVNGSHSDVGAVLEEGSRVGVFPPVGGG
jgi:molybdopterin converting factor small subunit